MEKIIKGKPLFSGQALGEALVSEEPLSFWGGYDYLTGEIIDRRHPLSGCNAAGKVLALPSSRGSSATPAALLEAVRSGTAPAAILTIGVDPFFALASIVAHEIYGKGFPVLALSKEDFKKLRSGDRLTIGQDGKITVKRVRGNVIPRL